MAIIRSLLDQDLYKLTMMQSVLHQFPSAQVRYRFKCRNQAVLAPLAAEIRDELGALETLSYQPEELAFLSQLPFFKSDFIEFLRLFRFDSRFLSVQPNGNELDITIEGPWLHTIQYEVFTLSIVQEVFLRNSYPQLDTSEGESRLKDKIQQVRQFTKEQPFQFADFGTRRRFSRTWQEQMITVLCTSFDNKTFVGTSNMDLARRYHLSPIGTIAHEYLQAGQALGPRLQDSQRFMLETWVKEYRGNLGIALSDVVGFDAFLKDFDLYFSKLYDGCRHDSGDPVMWGEKLIGHYKASGIDPTTKSAVFSDGLNFSLAFKLARHFKNRIHTSFGIGTNLSNDMGLNPLQIVMKMVECDGQPVAKISDSPGKGMCEDAQYLQYLKKVYQIEV